MKRILLGVPTHSESIHVGALHSIFRACSESMHDVTYKIQGLSLLGKNHNHFFCEAITNNFDYLVIHHSDLAVHDSDGLNWIDRLISVARENDAAVVSAPVPIKSPDGLLSCGLDLQKNNSFTLRRLTCKELINMPNIIDRLAMCEKFGVDSKTVGAMLVNTGCILLNLELFDWQAAEFPGFGIEDTIAWNAAGVPHGFTQPEDWRASRWLHAQGWNYVMTRDLIIEHFGFKSFTYLTPGPQAMQFDTYPRDPHPDDWRISK